MADSPLPEIESAARQTPLKKGQFGVALEPEAVRISGYAMLIGLVGGLVAEGLLQLIYFFTNVCFYGRFSFAITSPAHNHLGISVVFVPAIGGLLVGGMIYYWEPTLKGHGIPEAMEAVLFNHSRMRLRVAFLKPLATALAIGTGGPFGAEGPIIQTGAAVGSLFGRFIGLTPYYRRVLLASGAAAGMAATFEAPLAGILVAIELLLFEFRARSFIPVSLAAAVATGVRISFSGWEPLFPTPAYQLTGMAELWLFAALGILMGIVGIAMIRSLFWVEDIFDHLPFKRALIWSPAVGAVILGLIGYFVPEVFGTGYDTIRAMLNDRLTPGHLVGISVAKFWALVISLGSGTTGGVFAPSLIVGGGIGGAYGVICRHLFPHIVSDPAFYALVAMAAVFGGIARAPLTSIVFLFELSHNPNSLLPLIVCVMIADGFVRLFSPDSVMTGKLVKRGLIVLQDYSVPVLMRARIDQVMRKQFTVLKGDMELQAILRDFAPENIQLLPVVDKNGALMGIIEPQDLLRTDTKDHHFTMRELARQDYVRAYPGDLVDRVSRNMLLKNVDNVVVLESHSSPKPIGIVRANDILQLRRWLLEEESVEKGVPAAAGPVQPKSAS